VVLIILCAIYYIYIYIYIYILLLIVLGIVYTDYKKRNRHYICDVGNFGEQKRQNSKTEVTKILL
jgi:hypothetical protein